MTLATYDRLISSVEAGDCSRVSGDTIRKALGGNYIGWFFDAAKGDMNAALLLVRNALPKGWGAQITLLADDKGAFAKVYPPSVLEAGKAEAYDPDPARALLLAILKAKRSELEQRT